MSTSIEPAAIPESCSNIARIMQALEIGNELFWEPLRLVHPGSWAGHVATAFWLIKAIKPRMVVELGTQSGNSYSAFCQAIALLGLPTRAFAVDSWRGDEHAGFYDESVYNDLMAFNEAHFSGFSKLLRTNFDDARSYFADDSIDLLHIDGLHTYEAVKHDFETWKNAISPSGVVVFHDTNVRERGFGVWKFWQELAEEHSSFEFHHSEGLGILALGSNRSPLLSRLFELSGDPEASSIVRHLFTMRGLTFKSRTDALDLQSQVETVSHDLECASIQQQRLQQELDGKVTQVSALEHELDGKAIQVSALQQELEEEVTQVSALQQELEDKVTQVSALQQELEDKVTQVSALQQELEDKVAQVSALQQELEDKVTQGSALQQEILDRDSVIREKDHEIHLNNEDIREKTDYIAEVSQLADDTRKELGVIKKQYAVMECDLQDAHHRLRIIESSTSWQVISRVRAVFRGSPRTARWIGRLLRVIWWTATLQLFSRWRDRHRMFRSRNKIAASGLLDASWYRREYPDVADSGLDPALHYCLFGTTEHRNPSPEFDAGWYYEQNPDVARSGMNPLLHYLEFGKSEGREIRALQDGERGPLPTELSTLQVDPDPLCYMDLIKRSGLFNAGWYLHAYPDVGHARSDPATHYATSGWKEGKNPSPLFDTSWYLQEYNDVRNARINPLVHFLLLGNFEGRFPTRAMAQAALPNGYLSTVRSYFAASTNNFYNIRWSDEYAPYVSIVVLNFNKAYLTLQCLCALWEYTAGHKYEILVVDNGSDAQELERLTSIKGPFRLIRIAVNRFFGEGNNIGAESARGKLLVFMNNDVVATPDWLSPLVDALENQPNCGAAGPKFVYPDGRLQEAGAFIRKDGTALQRGKSGDPNAPEFNSPQIVDYVSAATVAIRKADFERVFGFDFRWDPAYYEDVDLCLKLTAIGLETCYVPTSTVIHCENATSSDKRFGLQLDNIVDINRVKFLERWGPYLTSRDIRSAEEIVGSPFQAQHLGYDPEKPRVAIFTPYAMIPGGGERYLLTIAESLLPLYNVALITPHQYSWIRISTIARTFNLSLANLHLATLESYLSEKPFDVWIAIGNSIIPPGRALGVHSLFLLQFPFPTEASAIQQGRGLWDEYERVIVYSNYVKKNVERQISSYMSRKHQIDIISPPVDIKAQLGAQEKRPGSIINVGRFFSGGHCKRQDLLVEVFRRLIRENGHMSMELHLVGSLHPEPEHRKYFQRCKDLAEGLPIFFHLDAGAAELENLYATSSIYWHATGVGVDLRSHPEKAEHFGISVVEAMSAGCIPVVFAEGGPAEIVENGQNGYHYGDTAELAAITLRIVQQSGEPCIELMRLEARKRASSYDTRLFRSKWQKIVEGALAAN